MTARALRPRLTAAGARALHMRKRHKLLLLCDDDDVQ